MENPQVTHRVLQKQQFESLVTEKSIFHTRRWRDMLEECMQLVPFAILTSRGDQPLLLTLFFRMKKGFFRFSGAPLPGSMTPFMDPLWLASLTDAQKEEIFASQYRFLKKEGYDYIEYRFRRYEDAALLQRQCDLTLTRPQTYLLPVAADEAQMWQKIKSRTRTKINKAKRLGVRVERLESAADEIPEFYGMLEDVFRKSGQKPGQPPLCYTRLVETMLPAKRLLFLKCSVDSQTATMGVFPYDDEMIYYLSGASHPIGYKVESNALMHWEVIRFAIENGIGIYDMGGKGIPSIDRFKASFGADVHDYGKLNYKTKTADLAEKIYKKIKNIR